MAWNGTIPGDCLHLLLQQSWTVRLKAVESQMILSQTPEVRNASAGFSVCVAGFQS